MEAEQSFCDPFATYGLLTLPALEEDASSSWNLSRFEQSLTTTTFALDEPEKEKLLALQEHLFSLNLDDVPLPGLESNTDSSTSSDVESAGDQPDGHQPSDEQEDLWEFPDIVQRVSKDGLLSWDSFVDEHYKEPGPVYLSEALAGTFGYILQLGEKTHDRRTVNHAQLNALQLSLRELSLGRESLFFGYDSDNATFTSRYQNYTILDVSGAITSSSIREFLQLGNDMRILRAFVEDASNTSANRMCQALSAAIRTVIYSLEAHLELSKVDSRSLLHLQEAAQKPRTVSAVLRTLMEHRPADTSYLPQLVRLSENLSENYPWLREVLQEIIARSAASEIELIGQSIGLGATTMSSGAVCSPGLFRRDLGADLLAPEMNAVLADSQQVVALLRDSCPGHPLLIHVTTHPINLRWEYSWESISKLQIRAAEYESTLKRAILYLCPPEELQNLPPLATNELSKPSELQEPHHHDLKISTMIQMVLDTEETSCQDTLYTAAKTALSDGYVERLDLRPDLDQSLSLSLMPLLTSQHRLLSYSVLSLLLETHGLRSHLMAQSRFQLLGDGLFASRLSHALFDSSEVSGEGRRLQGGRTGLRLQSRDTWPPASSELRLVLMSILFESMSSKDQHHNSKSTVSAMNPLLNSLSFAIRDLSDEDLEKCRDADTIYALDFLALQYKPPSSFLESVITPQSLKMYDEIFMHLLRLLRIQSTAQEFVMDVVSKRKSKSFVLPKDHKARLEIHHFISALADWTQNVVIGPKWTTFSSTIERIEDSLSKRDYDRVLENGKGLEYIRILHERVVDDIAKTLFLKRKHMEVRAVIDDIFGVVLQLAKQFRIKQTSSDESNDEGIIRQLYERFGKQVKRLLAYLRSTLTDIRDIRDSRGWRHRWNSLF